MKERLVGISIRGDCSQAEVDGMRQALRELGKSMHNPTTIDRIFTSFLLTAYLQVASECGLTQKEIVSEIQKGQATPQ